MVKRKYSRYLSINFAMVLFVVLYVLSATFAFAQVDISELESELGDELADVPLKDPATYPLEVQMPASTSITTVRALDKITAHITELTLPQDEVVAFGTLRITVRTCSSRSPEEIPETFAFLEIDDIQRNDELVRVFTGWMLASSPALNALEHSGYDIWVISCKIVDTGAELGNE
jgi:hypothetical protein